MKLIDFINITKNFDGKSIQDKKSIVDVVVEKYKPTGHPIYESIITTQLILYLDPNDLKSNKFIRNVLTKHYETFKDFTLIIDPYTNEGYNSNIRMNNFHSWRLFNMITIMEWLNVETDYYKTFYDICFDHFITNIFDDGKSFDYIERDSLTHHEYTLTPIIETIRIMNKHKGDENFSLYYNTNVKKGVDFMKPYLNNIKFNIMFINSKIWTDQYRMEYGKTWNKETDSNINIYNTCLDDFKDLDYINV
jgi:hypothetical protein